MAELHHISLDCIHVGGHVWVTLCNTHLEELGGHTLEGVAWPLTEPVDGAAVDKGGKLAQPCPAGVGAYLGVSTVSSSTSSSNARAGSTRGQDDSRTAVVKATVSKCALRRSS